MKLGALFGLTQSVNVMPYIAELSSEDRLVLLLEYERARPGEECCNQEAQRPHQ